MKSAWVRIWGRRIRPSSSTHSRYQIGPKVWSINGDTIVVSTPAMHSERTTRGTIFGW